MARRRRQTASGSDQRWVLIRDLVVFSAKAALEALRDLVLIPIALVAGVVGLLTRPRDPDGPFHEMLRVGRRFDDWLNLFGPVDSEKRGGGGRRSETVDAFFARVESIVLEQHKRGGITTNAKEAIDRALDRIQGTPAIGAGGDGSAPMGSRRRPREGR